MATQENIPVRSASKRVLVLLNLQEFRQQDLPANRFTMLSLIAMYAKDLFAILSEVIPHRRLPSSCPAALCDAFSRQLGLNATPKFAAHL